MACSASPPSWPLERSRSSIDSAGFSGLSSGAVSATGRLLHKSLPPSAIVHVWTPHADVAGNHVADALAQAGAERGELFAVPEAFYDGAGLGTWLAIRRLELVYLLRAGDEEGSSITGV